MWNSNLPKLNGIYIFGCYEYKDVTFFCGKNILQEREIDILLEFLKT